MKKILTLALAIMMIAAMIVPTSAVENKIVYSQDFNSVKTFDELGWEKIETLKTATGSMTIENGKLLVNNLKDETTNPKPQDSYWVVVPDKIMRSVIADDYTVQWDMEYLESGDAARYLVLLLNYDREMGNTYVSFHLRPKGWANFQSRLFGSWTHLDAAGSTEGNVTRPPVASYKADAVSPDQILSKYVFGVDYVDEKTSVLYNKPMTVRMEVHAGKCIKVFVNDKFVTATDDAGWENVSMFNAAADGYSEIALKVGTTIKGTMDNIYVATGIGIPASAKPVETTTAAPVTTKAPETTKAPAATTAAPVVTPATADMTAVYAMAAMALTAVVAALTKKARAK